MVPKIDLVTICNDKLNLIFKSSVMKSPDKLFLTLKILNLLVDLNTQNLSTYHVVLLDSLDHPDDAIKQLAIDILFKTISS